MKEEFETVMQGVPFAEIGVGITEPLLKIKGLDGGDVINADIHHLKNMWKYPLEDV